MYINKKFKVLIKKKKNVFVIFIDLGRREVFCTTYPKDQNLVVRDKKTEIDLLMFFNFENILK